MGLGSHTLVSKLGTFPFIYIGMPISDDKKL
jgi:hypothetical protein